jgi:hypothetical protein
MAIDRKDLEHEERMDEKVGVVKDIKRIANGDLAGTLRDDIEEMKSDFNAADDKIEQAVDSDDDDIPRRSTRPGYGENRY